MIVRNLRDGLVRLSWFDHCNDGVVVTLDPRGVELDVSDECFVSLGEPRDAASILRALADAIESEVAA